MCKEMRAQSIVLHNSDKKTGYNYRDRELR